MRSQEDYSIYYRINNMNTENVQQSIEKVLVELCYFGYEVESCIYNLLTRKGLLKSWRHTFLTHISVAKNNLKKEEVITSR